MVTHADGQLLDPRCAQNDNLILNTPLEGGRQDEEFLPHLERMVLDLK